MAVQYESPIFALDIGTRSVVGLLLKRNKNMYEIIDIISKEHDERAMLDGQIHNVLAVSEIISEIKQTLEEKHGTLKKVCVAAAGRSLKTKRAQVDITIAGKSLVNQDDILHLELSAVQKAQYALAQDFDDKQSFNYYCVGYSVVDYRLDGEKIGSLVDQSGNTATVEVIATFLPKVVVESLIAALSRSELELEALTLEPIAAINVLIPPSMRRLNVALVDIGAGTSDIAITDEGTVTAYGMVPTAGDEVTEAISDQYLLDFPEAEMIKRELSDKDEVVLTDILGFETTYQKDEVIASIEDVIINLATAITNEILELNQKPPKAVMLVGGGSMTPNLAKHVAAALQLPDNRVAIRGIDAIKLLAPCDKIEAGPELVTPIGIAIAAKENPIEYISVTVNDKPIRLFDIKQLTVGDGLLAAGIEFSKLYGKPGMALMVNINKQLISVPGEHGHPPLLLKNGEAASLDTPLEPNDIIVVEKGIDGGQARASIKDVVEEVPTLELTVNKETITVTALIHKNGKLAHLNEKLDERDSIDVQIPKTIKDVLAVLERFEDIENAKPFYVFLSDKKIPFKSNKTLLLLNGQEAELETEVNYGDHLQIKTKTGSLPTASDLLEKLKIPTKLSISVYFNDEPLHVEKPIVEIQRDGKSLEDTDTLVHGEQLTIVSYGKSPFIFQDLFRKVKIDLTPQPNKKLLIKKNNQNATFSEKITGGDRLEVRLVPHEVEINPEV